MSGIHFSKVWVCIFSLIFMYGCASVNRNVSNLIFPPYPSSDQRDSESVQLVLDECPPVEPAPGAAAAAVLPGMVATEIIERTKQFLKDEAERYTATYSASVVGDQFYKSADPSKLENFYCGVKLTRKIADNEAMSAKFLIEPTKDRTAFKLVLSDLKVTLSKAKVTAIDFTRPLGFDILAPWTIAQTYKRVGSLSALSPLRPAKIDLNFHVVLTAVWTDEKQVSKSQQIISQDYQVKNVKLGEKVDKLNVGATQLFPMIPRSFISKEESGFGNFVLSILVTEYDNYGERVKELGSSLEKNEKSIKAQISDALTP